MRGNYFERLTWRLVLAVALLVGGLATAPVRAATDVIYVSATGHYMRGVFRDFWDKRGGVAIFGYPLTEEYIDPTTNRVYQFFERARFERALPNSTVVELGFLGRQAAGDRVFDTAAPITNTKDRRYFPETKHMVQYGFKDTWEGKGGLAIFGLPLSEEIGEQLADGKMHQVQYFERARFEYWGDLPAGQRVLLSLLGRRFAPLELTPPLGPNAPPPALGAPVATPVPTPVATRPPTSPINGPSLVRPVLPPSKNARVLPQAGQPGEGFFFEAFGFKAGEQVGIWVNSPDGAIIGARFQASADSRGTINDAGISFGTSEDSPLGVWSFVAQGVDSGKQAVGYFLLIGGALGRAPTPPEAGPGVPPNVDARSDPAAGKAGTIFFFDAFGFKAGEEVAMTIFASDGTPIDAGFTVKADAKGAIGYAGLYYVTEPYYPLGLWRFVATGKESGKVSTAYFVLTP
ncbi:MAG: hypothetical protein ABIV47_21405 [Roseiflexaceae bacterium]